jgi:hypothetical protein
MVFTAPLARTEDESRARRLLAFHGAKVVCGGATGSIFAAHLGRAIKTERSTNLAGFHPSESCPRWTWSPKAFSPWLRPLKA